MPLAPDGVSIAARSPLVAVAEPEPALRRKLAAALERRGCDVIEVRDGLELLEYLGEARERDEDWPQLVVAEETMPGLGGLDVLAELREAGAPMPPATILLVNEQDACPGLRLAARALGVAVVLDKPLDPVSMGWWVHRLVAALPDRR